jgi:hypothetical protein
MYQMYVVGINVQLKNRTAQDDALRLPSPTSSQFKAALEMVREWLPLECVSCDPQELLFHGTSPWSCECSFFFLLSTYI